MVRQTGRRSGRVPLRVLGGGRHDLEALRLQLRSQDGVISRAQLEALGLTYADIQRMLRRRELSRMARGIYVDHTGRPSWHERAWAAVIHAWPAALSHESVWSETSPIHVAVGPARSIRPLPGSVLHRMPDLDERVSWAASPPKVLIEYAALEAAAAATTEQRAIAVLTGAVQRRETTYQRLAETLAARGRTRRGNWLAAVLADLAAGTNSVLEHGYLLRVERPHGLPRARRQQVSYVGGRRTERDAVYPEFGVYVELDGRTFHDTASARDRDLDRDLDAAAALRVRTVRLGWGQVFDRPCRTATRIAALLHQGGWTGTPTRCARCTGS